MSMNDYAFRRPTVFSLWNFEFQLYIGTQTSSHIVDVNVNIALGLLIIVFTDRVHRVCSPSVGEHGNDCKVKLCKTATQN